MSGRRGYALAAVLAVLVIMAMSVAVGAQRALRTRQQAALELARSELAAAVESGQAAGLDALTGAPCCPDIIPGAVLAAGEGTAGKARTRWRLIGAAAPYATLELAAEMPVRGGFARVRQRVLVAWRADSVGGGQWVPAGASGWTRLPSP